MEKKRPSNRGFSLILSLTIMAAMTMLLLSLSAFMLVESRAAMNQQLAVRARLNSIVSLRLALAHLQQTTGPDRRATARADITQPNTAAVDMKNSTWTGVWRTDLPDLPPAWLVSGRADQQAGAQSVSLYKYVDYPDSYWVPWKNDLAQTFANNVILIGAGSAVASDGIKPSGLVSLPAIDLPDSNVNGSYAYWIGDEGIKARINLTDSRTNATNTAGSTAALRSPAVSGYGLITGLSSLTNASQLLNIISPRSLTLLDGFPAGNTGTATAKGLFHDISLVSAGVIADSLNGGLKRDLSLAFELTDPEFAASEFGEGIPDKSDKNKKWGAGTHTENGVENIADFPEKMMPVMANGANPIYAAPVFSRTTADGNLRGPSWWALRDYHRLYRQLGWTSASPIARSLGTPSLNARTLWPNVSAAHPSGTPASSGLPNNNIRDRLYGYSDIYNGDLPAPINPNTSAYLNGDTGKIITRPLNCAASPYLQKLSLVFSVNKTKVVTTTITRIGRTIYITTMTSYQLLLNVTPIVVIHNPYNVAMTWSPTTSGTQNYPASISVSNMSGWIFRFTQMNPANTPAYVMETPISDFFKIQDALSNNDDTFRIYLTQSPSTNITLQPGELRVFSCAPASKTTTTPSFKNISQSVLVDNNYDTRGGFSGTAGFGDSISWTDAINDGLIDPFSPITFEVIPGGDFRIRHSIACWPGDRITAADNTENFFRNSSEASETVVTNITPSLYPVPPPRWYQNWDAVINRYPNGAVTSTSAPLPPDVVAVVDVSAKTADAVGAPFPTFTHSNPMAPTRRASATGRSIQDSGLGFKGASPSLQFSLHGGTWDTVIELPTTTYVPSNLVNKVTFGGYSSGSAGKTTCVIQSEIPLVPPTSLAQFAHANFGTRDQQPLLSIGNSFASPLISAQQVMQDNGPNWTEYDQSYLLNASLWDSYFLSSAAPQMKTSNVTAATPTPTDPNSANNTPNPHTNEAKWLYATPLEDPTGTMQTVIKDFVNNGIPLDNPRFTLTRSNQSSSDTEKALTNHRTSASVLFNQGAFNVNSTSVDAWKAFLGSTKNLPVAGLAANAPTATANARFIRAINNSQGITAGTTMSDPSNWAGIINLTDNQITNLAQAIVDENKARFALRIRSERDLASPPQPRKFGGLTSSATPYLGLSEFINRFLTVENWANRCGALQAAIIRSDARNSGTLSAKSSAPIVKASSLQMPTAGWFSNPENIELTPQASSTPVTHTAYGAPGNLLQSDLLAAFGSALATRSDTFILRCYGDAANDTGEKGRSWMEVVVQRYPEFVDPSNVPETGTAAPRTTIKTNTTGAPDPTLSNSLTPVNSILGRRFKIISMRWLKLDEI